MVNVIVFSTLIGSLISGFLGRYIGILWSRIIVCSSVIISLIATYILYYDVMVLDYEYRNIIMSWISVDYLNIDWGFLIDKVSVSVLIPVVTISSLVHIYAVVYMSHDPHQQRFFSYLSFFTFGMIVLVTGDNLLILFLGWELIGVASYLLISFWFTRISAGKSGLNSLLLNRFGDTFFVIGLGLTVYLVGSLNFDTLFSLNGYLSTDMLTIILICMLIGCASKSVQFGLHTWLLNSMEGFEKGALVKFHYMLEHLFNIDIYSMIIDLLFKLDKMLWFLNFNTGFFFLKKGITDSEKIQSVRQSAGNQSVSKDTSVGSSETTREKYYKVPARTPCGADKNFIAWLIGFTEGDGSFIVNASGTLEFKVTQSSTDVQVLYYIKKKLGFGSVSPQDLDNNTHHFRVRDKEGLLKIINIFNGNIYLLKVQLRFKNFLKHYNKYYKTNILLKEHTLVPSFENGWLSGFIDAEGCLTCGFKDKTELKNNKISMRLIVSQKECEEVMDDLNLLLQGAVNPTSDGGFNITVGIKKMKAILDYLKVYKLRTQKVIQYKSFIKIHELVYKQIHVDSEEGYQKVKKLMIKYKKLLN